MDYIEILNKFKEYYANLLIVQYNNKPKAAATIKLLVDLIYINLILMRIRDGFDWRTAVGAQLDIIGKWIGIARTYNGSLFWDNTYLSYPKSSQLVSPYSTDNLQHGYSNYETFSPIEAYIVGSTAYTSDWLSLTPNGSALTPVDATLYEIKTAGSFYNKVYEWNGEEYIEISLGSILTYKDLGFVEQELSDDDYRVIIGLKIIKNNINHTCKNIDDAIWEYFGGKNLYSNESLSVGTILYTKKDLNPTSIYGEVSSLTDGITITKSSGIETYAYVNSTQDNDIYIISAGNIYTTWQPHEITYHYDSSLTTIINVCNYKNVLPVPTGMSINLAQI